MGYEEEILSCERGEALARVAQRSCGWFIPTILPTLEFSDALAVVTVTA